MSIIMRNPHPVKQKPDSKDRRALAQNLSLTTPAGRAILNWMMNLPAWHRIDMTEMERSQMKRIQTIETRDLSKSVQNGGCGECQTSCQSACKTSCGVANQKCENPNK